MPISASKIVQINPRVIQAGSNELEITGLLLTKNPLVPFPAILIFDSKDAAGNYFGTDSEEYRLAAKYFLGYDDSFAKPRKLYFARRADSALPAFLIGQSISANLSAFQKITDGAFGMEMDGTSAEIDGVNLSGATSYSEIAEKIQESLQAKFPGSTLLYSSLTNGFILTSGKPGTTSSIGYLATAESGTDLAELLGMNISSSVIQSKGSAALDGVAQMERITEQTRNFVTFTTVYEAGEEEMLDLARWVTEQQTEYLYVLWSDDAQLLSQTAGDTVSDKIVQNDYGSTTAVFGSAEYAVFIMATAASIDWTRLGGTINFAFKSQTGLAATVTDSNSADILTGRGFNYYGRFATRAEDFLFLYDGRMFGAYGYIDAFINTVWLRNVIQTALMQGLKQTGRAPYTEGGYALIRAWMTDPIERALKNGVLEAGVSLSARQKAEVQQEAGLDISTDLFTKGYFLQVLDPGAQARVNRDSPIINLWYTYGGSINRLVVPVSAIL